MKTEQIRQACAILDSIAHGNANEKTVFDMHEDCAALASIAGTVSQRLGDMHSQIVADNNEILRLRAMLHEAGAALENILLHQGKHMTAADFASRSALAASIAESV